jgi:hypothetical protein
MNVQALDAKIVRFFPDAPRSSVLEASRVLGVARALALIKSTLDRMSEAGVTSSWVRRPDPSRFGFPVVAFATRTLLRASSVIVLNAHFQGRAHLLEAAAAMQPE